MRVSGASRTSAARVIKIHDADLEGHRDSMVSESPRPPMTDSAADAADAQRDDVRRPTNQSVGTGGSNSTNKTNKRLAWMWWSDSKDKDESVAKKTSTMTRAQTACSSAIEKQLRKMQILDEKRTPAKMVDIVVCGVIVVNAFLIVLEVDFGPRDPNKPLKDRLFWFIAEVIFTFFYLGELVFRIWLQRCKWLRSVWNWVDATVVIVGMVDCLLLTLLLDADMPAIRVLAFLRMARLIRLVRLVRLVRMCRGLYIMVMAFMHAMSSLFWIGILVSLGLLLFATFFTIIVGHSPNFDTVMIRGDPATSRFGTVPRSMYTLFELMTLEGWHEIARPIIMEEPSLAIVVFSFIFIFTFGLLNMIVAIVVEKTLAFAREQNAAHREEWKLHWKEDLEKMKHIFIVNEVATNGEVVYDAFAEALANDKAVREALNNLGIPTNDALELFTTLDVNGDGSLTLQEFLGGLAKFHGATTQRWDEMATHAGVQQLLRQERAQTAERGTRGDASDKILKLLEAEAEARRGMQSELAQRFQAMERTAELEAAARRSAEAKVDEVVQRMHHIEKFIGELQVQARWPQEGGGQAKDLDQISC